MFDFYQLFIHCINTQRGCHTLKKNCVILRLYGAADCEVQTTTQLEFIRFWPLKRTAKTHEATFFLRAAHSACIELRVSPAAMYPHIRVSLFPADVSREYKTKHSNVYQIHNYLHRLHE